jgi:alkaline phosphatase
MRNVLAVAAVFAAALPVAGQEAKNVILMVSDGAGDTTWQAANQFQFGTAAGTGPQFQQRFEQSDFSQHWMTTFPGHTQPINPSQTGGLLPPLYNEVDNFPGPGGYDPMAANDPTPASVTTIDNNGLLGRGTPVSLTLRDGLTPTQQSIGATFAASLDLVETPGFAAYDYLITNSVTDSAAAGTALASGVKSYNTAINVDLNEQPVGFITQQMVASGRKAGVVTTKPFTDATPSAFGTQNVNRNNEREISESMIRNGLLDVIISPGHPEFGSGGVLRDTPDFDDALDQSQLQALRNGEEGWTFIDDNSQLVGIGEGTVAAPERLFGMVPVGGSLNSRDTAGRTNAYDPRFYDSSDPNGAVPFVMPDLDQLSRTAIETLEQDEDGFFLMIEGASVDSAAHANDLPRLVEEQLAFNRAVDEVIEWVETESSWDETLLIITTDHANAMFLGPDSADVYFQDPIAGEAGELPEGIFWSTNHTNELVPLWTKGVGSELFDGLVDGVDPRRGAFIDNTDVHTVMQGVIPEPASLSLLAAAGTLLLRRRPA